MIFDIDEHIRKINIQWQNFINNKPVDTNIVNKMIYDSWQRCKTYAIDPNMSEYNHVLSEDEMKKRLEKNAELINVAWPILETLADNISETNFRVDLFDSEAYLLKTKGKSEIIEDSKRLKSFPGVSKREEHSGTNAIALSYLHKKPVLVIGPEHYIRLFHFWSCATAPIHNLKGEIIGFVNMTGYRDKIHPHTLGMVVSIVKAIEQNLKLHEITKELSRQNALLENIIDTVEKGLIVIDENGYIKKMSRSAYSLLEIDKTSEPPVKINEIFDSWQSVHSQIKNCKRAFSQELTYKRNKINKNLYLEIKPMQLEDCTQTLVTFQEIRSIQNLAKRFGTTGARFSFKDIIGSNKGLAKVTEMAKRIAKSNAKVLLLGESGTGKELFAHAIHNCSNYRHGPFVTLNCAAIPSELIESELFGYEEGAFTGARKGGMIGKIEMADGGTLFLDEINSMTLNLQAKLLRFLQSNTFTRLGGQKELEVDVRIIAASNKDLKREIEKGNFREDLYYRLNVVSIFIPPLRERKEDIPDLIHYFIAKFSRILNANYYPDPSFIEVLTAYHWPGNVRELENTIERAIAVSTDYLLTPQCLPDEICKPSSVRSLETTAVTPVSYKSLREMERKHLMTVLKDTGGNISKTARILGVSRNTVYRKIKEMNIEW